jgi:hypothetical protein
MLDRTDRAVLDMDSSESPVHSLSLFNDHGNRLAAKLRPGNVLGADDWDEGCGFHDARPNATDIRRRRRLRV